MSETTTKKQRGRRAGGGRRNPNTANPEPIRVSIRERTPTKLHPCEVFAGRDVVEEVEGVLRGRD
jgi:hypothetical protein